MVSNDNLPFNIWKPDLYTLQKQAPRPRKVPNEGEIERPLEFKDEYHGLITCKEAETRLVNEGDYLVRRSKGSPLDISTLSFRVNFKVHHYKLYFDGQFYVNDKKFEQLEDLVAEGLLINFIEKHESKLIHSMSQSLYATSPHVTLYRTNKTLNCTQTNHNFKTHNFKGFNWCEHCAHFLWGFSAQGVKCTYCGFSAHRKCSQNVPNDCAPSLKSMRGVFCVDLTTFVTTTKPYRKIPWVISKCVEEIERRGIEVEGLYRVSGFTEEISDLKNKFETERENTDISESVYENIHVITGVLKLFLRLLPLPLLAYDIHPDLIKAAGMFVNLRKLNYNFWQAVNGLPAIELYKNNFNNK